MSFKIASIAAALCLFISGQTYAQADKPAPYSAQENDDGIELTPSGLIVAIPHYNQDLQLLQYRQRLNKAMKKNMIEFSGKFEVQANTSRDADGSTDGGIEFSEIELDAIGYITPWVTGFLSLGYDNDFSTRSLPRGGSLDKAFITLGNLNQSPFYATAGQRYLPFGQYDNYMVTPPVTRFLGRTKVPQLSIGYQHTGNYGLYATIFTYRGQSQLESSSMKRVGGTLGYQYEKDQLKTDVGIDYISNIADSQGMQKEIFNENNILMKRVPAMAAHGKISISDYSLVAEYLTTTTSFDPANLTFNDVAAKPTALSLTAVYAFKSWGKPSEVAVYYGKTKDALALNLPQSRASIAYNLVLSKNFVFSVEYRRDKEYAATTVSQAQGNVLTGEGSYSQAVTGQLTYFF